MLLLHYYLHIYICMCVCMYVRQFKGFMVRFSVCSIRKGPCKWPNLNTLSSRLAGWLDGWYYITCKLMDTKRLGSIRRLISPTSNIRRHESIFSWYLLIYLSTYSPFSRSKSPRTPSWRSGFLPWPVFKPSQAEYIYIFSSCDELAWTIEFLHESHERLTALDGGSSNEV